MAEIDKFVDSFMTSAECGRDLGRADPFWDKSEKAFLTALIFYVLENDDIPKYDKCFDTILKKIQKAEPSDDECFVPIAILRKMQMAKTSDDDESPLTREMHAWFKKMDAEERPCKAKLYYDTFLIAPQKTQTTILCTIRKDLKRYISYKSNGISWATESDFIRKLSESREFTKRQSVFSAGISW